MIHHITPVELETVLNIHARKGARPARLETLCPVKLLKKSRLNNAPCEFGDIFKRATLSVLVNFDYAGNVNRQREREDVEPDFVAKPNWFAHVTPAIVAHKTTGERYAFVRVLRNLCAPAFELASGQLVERQTLIGFLPVDDLTDFERAACGLPVKPANDHQQIDAEIQPITIRLANVISITVDKTTYNVIRTITPETITKTTPAPVLVPARDDQRLARAVLHHIRALEHGAGQ